MARQGKFRLMGKTTWPKQLNHNDGLRLAYLRTPDGLLSYHTTRNRTPQRSQRAPRYRRVARSPVSFGGT